MEFHTQRSPLCHWERRLGRGVDACERLAVPYSPMLGLDCVATTGNATKARPLPPNPPPWIPADKWLAIEL